MGGFVAQNGETEHRRDGWFVSCGSTFLGAATWGLMHILVEFSGSLPSYYLRTHTHIYIYIYIYTNIDIYIYIYIFVYIYI